jgi:hypothetical protein
MAHKLKNMKSFINKILLVSAFIVVLGVFESCSNARYSTGMSMNMTFGPGGPRVTPSFNVGVYSGGRY